LHLNESTEGAITTPLGKLFRMLTILGVNVCFHMS